MFTKSAKSDEVSEERPTCGAQNAVGVGLHADGDAGTRTHRRRHLAHLQEIQLAPVPRLRQRNDDPN